MKKSLGAQAWMYPEPVFVVGSYTTADHPNFATASFGCICCSQPPCVAVSLRKETCSYDNILKSKAFTINIPSQAHLAAVDYLGIISGKVREKVAATRLTAVKSRLVAAPYIKEFPVVLECKVVDVCEIGAHTQFIGEIQDVKADEAILGPSGAVDILALKPLIYTPDTQEYYGVGPKLGKVFSAAKGIK